MSPELDGSGSPLGGYDDAHANDCDVLPGGRGRGRCTCGAASLDGSSSTRWRKKPVVVDAIRNDGTWPPIMDWLDRLAGGRASIPFGSRPAITRKGRRF